MQCVISLADYLLVTRIWQADNYIVVIYCDTVTDKTNSFTYKYD